MSVQSNTVWKQTLQAAVGNAIRKRRVAMNVEAKLLSERLGVNAAAIHLLESGASVPFYLVVGCAQVLDCGVDDLVPIDARPPIKKVMTT